MLFVPSLLLFEISHDGKTCMADNKKAREDTQAAFLILTINNPNRTVILLGLEPKTPSLKVMCSTN